MDAAIGITHSRNETATLLMLLERVARRLNQAGALLCVCSGSMVVALMLSSLISFCSRLHGVAAPTVSYVSARTLVRPASVRVCICVSVCASAQCRCVEMFSFVCLQISDYRYFFEGINFELMEKCVFIFKVTSNVD
jgi:hypothetical protein